MGTFSVGGLATGLDTAGIIEQLIAIDSRPKVKLEWNRALWDARKSGWNDLSTRLNSLQGYANALLSPSTWQVFSGITSSDPTRVTGTSNGPQPAAGSYDINVTALAATEVWNAANSLPAATSGVRRTGVWYEGAGNAAEATDRLVNLRDQTNTNMGLNSGSTITMQWEKGGNTYSSTFTVTNTNTLGDLVTWAQSQIPGATATLAGGQIELTSAPGTADEVTSLRFTATDSAGTTLTRFNGSLGAQSSIVTAATDGGATAADTLAITQGSQTWYVNVAKGDNEFDIINAINSTAGIGVSAGISGGRLQLTAKDSGAAASFTVSSTGSLAADLGLSETTAGADAAFTVNGTPYTRSKNTGITDVITDVSLDLLGLTGGTPVTLTVGQAAASNADIKKKILDFVNQYNSIIDFVGSKTGERKVTNPKNLTEYLQGPLSRDYAFSSIAFDLRKQMGDSVAGLPAGSSMLADIGITGGPYGGTGNTSGKLIVDEAKLDQALNTDRQKVQDIFSKVGAGAGVAPDDGIARRVSEMVSQWRTGGKVDAGLQGATAQITRLQDSIDRMSDRIERKRAYYERMFASLETTIGRMQQQSSWLSGQLAGLM